MPAKRQGPAGLRRALTGPPSYVRPGLVHRTGRDADWDLLATPDEPGGRSLVLGSSQKPVHLAATRVQTGTAGRARPGCKGRSQCGSVFKNLTTSGWPGVASYEMQLTL